MNLFALEYNGVTIDSSIVDIVVNEMSGTQGVEVRTSSENNTIYNGGQIYKQLSGMRVISLSFTFSGTDAADYFALQSQLLTAFSHSAAIPTLKITRWDGVQKQITGYVITEPDVLEGGGKTTFNTTQVQIQCADVYFSDSAEQTITLLGASTGGLPIPAPVPAPILQSGANDGVIVNNGNAVWYPEITFNGQLTTPVITNLTTGESLGLTTTLLAGNSVRAYYDSKSPYIILNGTTPYWANTTGRIPQVAVGNNTFRLTTGSSSDSGNVTISYRSQFKGL